jgi:hypothetical protein
VNQLNQPIKKKRLVKLLDTSGKNEIFVQAEKQNDDKYSKKQKVNKKKKSFKSKSRIK